MSTLYEGGGSGPLRGLKWSPWTPYLLLRGANGGGQVVLGRVALAVGVVPARRVAWEKQALSARGSKRVGRRSEYAV